MKTTISALLIPIIGAFFITLTSCSGVRAADDAGITGPTLCPISDSIPAGSEAARCPR